MEAQGEGVKAGPGLDSLVAKSMGLPVRWGEDPSDWRQGRITGIVRPWLHGEADGKIYDWQPIPAYTSSLDAAGAVLEKVRWSNPEGEGFAWTLMDVAPEGWKAEIWFVHHDGPVVDTEAIAPTLPLAICLAALGHWGVKNCPELPLDSSPLICLAG